LPLPLVLEVVQVTLVGGPVQLRVNGPLRFDTPVKMSSVAVKAETLIVADWPMLAPAVTVNVVGVAAKSVILRFVACPDALNAS
jgi:hypothetical protein